MDKNKLLNNANISQELWDKCYITEDGIIFTPHFTQDGVMDNVGEEVYNEWENSKN